MSTSPDSDLPDINTLIKTYSQKVYNTGHRMPGNPADAEDLVPERFLSVHQYLKDFKGKSSICAWIYKTAFNPCLHHKNRMRKVIPLSLDKSIDRDHQPVPDGIAPELSEAGRRVLPDKVAFYIQQKCYFFTPRHLTDEQRMVFLLVDIVELSYRDSI